MWSKVKSIESGVLSGLGLGLVVTIVPVNTQELGPLALSV